MTATPNDLLLETSVFQALVDHAEQHAEGFLGTLGQLLTGFFAILEQKSMTGLPDLASLTSPTLLQRLIDRLVETRNTCSHKYKKLHFTYYISLLKNQLTRLTQGFSPKTKIIELLPHLLQPADIVLLSSTRSHKKSSLKTLTTKVIATTLEALTDSPFCHVGIVGALHPKYGFELYHSTSSVEKGHSGVKKTRLTTYLDTTSPCYLLALRHTALNDHDRQAIIDHAKTMYDQHIPYDKGDALSDLTGLSFLRSSHRVNCGEFIYECLKALCPQLHKEGSALPSTYEALPFLEQVYLQRF